MAVVLLYHRIGAGSAASDPWRLVVSERRFAEQIDYLVARHAVVPLAELVDAHRRGILPIDGPRVATAITFDDGYAASLATALPMLRAAGAPATVFLAPDLLDRPAFWWDRLALACAGEGAARRDEIWQRLRSASAAERDVQLDELERAAADSPAVGLERPLTTAEARALASEAIAVGSHTATHPWLPDLDAERLAAEIVPAHERCRAWNRGRETFFAYPYGACDEAVAAAVRATGIGAAFTTQAEALAAESDPLRLPRLPVEDWSGEQLGAAIARAEERAGAAYRAATDPER